MKKPKVMALVSNGVEEMELVITVDILRRGGIDVDIVSIQHQTVNCSRMTKIVADKLIDQVVIEEYDVLFIPGGAENAKNLKESTIAKKIIEFFWNSGKLIAAICAGPTVVNHYIPLDNFKATCYPSLSNELKNYVDSAVVEDGNLITSQGPATTFHFALSLLEKIKGKELKETVAQSTLFTKHLQEKSSFQTSKIS